ncbi:M48 family metalloprotease [Micromonospora sp. PTRAS2]
MTDLEVDRSAWLESYLLCKAPSDRRSAVAMIGGLSLLTIAYGIYHAQSAWRMHRRGINPLPLEDNLELNAVVAHQSAASGLRITPRLYYDTRAGATPAAFGRASDPKMTLSHGMFIAYTRDRVQFDAVLQHELFHFRDHDVSFYYRSLAVFRSVVAAGTLYAVLIFGIVAFAIDIMLAAVMAIQFLASVLVATGMLRDYLRRREFRADMYAGDMVGVAAVKATLQAKGTIKPRYLRFFDGHPEPRDRLAALDDRRRALEFTPLAAAFTGIATSVLVANFALLISKAGVPWLNINRYGVSGAIVGAAFGGILCVGIWRNIHLDLIARRRPRTGLVSGLAAAAGVVAGGFLPAQTSFDEGGPLIPLAWYSLMAMGGIVLLALYLALAGWLRLRMAPVSSDCKAYRAGVIVASVLGAGIGAGIYLFSTLLRARQSLQYATESAPLFPNALPPPVNHELAIAVGLVQRWDTYALVGIAVFYLLIVWLQGLRSRHMIASEDNQTRLQVAPEGASIRPDRAASPFLVTMPQAPSVLDSAATAMAPARAAALLVFALASIGLVALVGASTPYLPFLLITVTSALGLAWADLMGWQMRRSIVLTAYVITALAAITAMGYEEDYVRLAVALSLLCIIPIIGSLGILIDRGSRHVLAILAPALLLAHEIWILAIGLVVGGTLVGLAVVKVADAQEGARKPSERYGMAIALVMTIAVEFLLR